MEGDTAPVVNEIATLLDQCSPEELQKILAEIQGESVPHPAQQAQPFCAGDATLPPPTPAVGPVTMPGGAQVLICDDKERMETLRQLARDTFTNASNSGRLEEALAEVMGSPAAKEPTASVPKASEACRNVAQGPGATWARDEASVVGEHTQMKQARELQPVPPAAPPPGYGRRPIPASMKRAEAVQEQTEPNLITVDEVKALLDQHSEKMLGEMRKLMPTGGYQAVAPPVPPVAACVDATSIDAVDVETLTNVLVDRDREVRDLEAKLAELQQELTTKDRRVAELGGELDSAVREVRHRQLDLEFQQLKLEERVRSNAELEQAQSMLTSRMEEATLTARHAAIEVEMCRSTPRSVRVQGTLPWTLRKNRIS